MNISDKEKDYTKQSIDEDIKQINDLETGKNTKKNIIKYVIYLVIILLITALVLYFNLSGSCNVNGKEYKVIEIIPEALSGMNWWVFLLFFGVTGVVFAINALIIFLFARLYQRHYSYHQALACLSTGDFYSAVTPGASGGQVAQVYLMKKQGVQVSNGASIFIMNYICYQIVLVLVGIISVFTRLDLITSIPAIPLDIVINGASVNIPISLFIILGFLLNVLVVALLFFMALSTRFHHFIVYGVMGFLAKIHLIKNVEKKRESLKIQVENFRVEFKRLQTNLTFTIFLILLNFIVIALKNTYPLLAGACLNGFKDVTDVNWWSKIYDCIVLSNFHQMATGLIPIPGSAGISEYVFERLFGSTSGFFPATNFYAHGGSQMTLLLWRFVTFYFPFFINGIVTATYRTRGKYAQDGVFVVPPDRKTMLTIQFETLEERKSTDNEKITLINKSKKNKNEVTKEELDKRIEDYLDNDNNLSESNNKEEE